MAEYDLLIINGLLFDGGLAEPRIADIAVSGDRIVSVGAEGEADAAEVVDAEGMAVCPGFIDTHAHSDFTIVADPRAEGKVRQGITTEISGNCGMSAAPLLGKAVERREEDLKELGIGKRWHTFREYFDIIEQQGIGFNLAFLAGHGNLRGSVVGYEDKGPTSGELAAMQGLLQQALDDGAIGLSTGLIYPPGVYSKTEELIELSRVVGRRGIYTSHMRSEGDRLEKAVEEVLRIGREADVQVHISHIKTAGERNWGKAEKVIASVEAARAEGVRVTCDRYPYTASSTDLDTVLPSWVYDGGNDEELRRLQDKSLRTRIVKEMTINSSAGSWEKVIVSSVATEKNRWMEGKTIAAISRELHRDVIGFLFGFLIEERLRVGAIFMSMSEDNLQRFLSLPYCMIGSDSSARCFDGPTRLGKPHPRTFGTFPRFLGSYVREKGLFPLSVAIHKATQLAAETFGLDGRGTIAEGMFADIVVFDPEKIIDRATFGDPFHAPEGVHYVFLNGQPAVWQGRATGNLAGRVLRS